MPGRFCCCDNVFSSVGKKIISFHPLFLQIPCHTFCVQEKCFLFIIKTAFYLFDFGKSVGGWVIIYIKIVIRIGKEKGTHNAIYENSERIYGILVSYAVNGSIAVNKKDGFRPVGLHNGHFQKKQDAELFSVIGSGCIIGSIEKAPFRVGTAYAAGGGGIGNCIAYCRSSAENMSFPLFIAAEIHF